MRTCRHMGLWAVLTVSTLAVEGGPAAAGQGLESDVATLQVEVRSLREELNALRRELQRLTAPASAGEAPAAEADRPASAPAVAASTALGESEESQEPSIDEVVPMLAAQVAEQAQTKVESNSRLPLKIFGMIVSNTFYNTGEPAWIDSPDFVLPPRQGFAPGSFSSTLRQSRLGASIDGPDIGPMRASGFLSVDFNGGVVNFRTGQVMGIPRMLYAYMRLDGERTAVEVGQDQMILAPRNPTSVAALYFPDLYSSGNLYLRLPQIRVERAFPVGASSTLEVTGGILAPVAGDFRPEEFVFILPVLAGERSRRPALQGRVAWRGRAGSETDWEFGLSGHDSRARFSSGSAVSRAGAFDFDLHTRRVGLGGEWYLGRNIEAFGAAIRQPGTRARGGYLEGRLQASDRMNVNAGFGLDRLIDREVFPSPLVANSTIFGNVMIQWMPEFLVSFEYRWTSTRPAEGEARRNHHFNLTFAYSF
ncbi:MAG: hypothetical protein HYX74_08895 [Acidobacteria bacterium]|nr:hypothetical protein [Acidobacteriota bacterium]